MLLPALVPCRFLPYLFAIFVLISFGFIYWDLCSKNYDLQIEAERSQAAFNLSLSEQNQLEKKNGALKESVRNLDQVVMQLQRQGKVDEEEKRIMRTEKETLKLDINNCIEVQVRLLNREIEKLKEEITAAQNKTDDHYKQIENINKVLEDKDVELVNLKKQLAQATELLKEQDNNTSAEGSIIEPVEHVQNRPLEAAGQEAHPSSFKQS